MTQKQEGKERILRYASRVYHGVEVNYLIEDKKLLANMFKVEQFYMYLFLKWITSVMNFTLKLKEMTVQDGETRL